MFKISDKAIKFISEAMKNCKEELTTGGKTLAEVKIQRSNFQEDALSPLVLVIVMMPLNYVLR